MHLIPIGLDAVHWTISTLDLEIKENEVLEYETQSDDQKYIYLSQPFSNATYGHDFNAQIEIIDSRWKMKASHLIVQCNLILLRVKAQLTQRAKEILECFTNMNIQLYLWQFSLQP